MSGSYSDTTQNGKQTTFFSGYAGREGETPWDGLWGGALGPSIYPFNVQETDDTAAVISAFNGASFSPPSWGGVYTSSTPLSHNFYHKFNGTGGKSGSEVGVYQEAIEYQIKTEPASPTPVELNLLVIVEEKTDPQAYQTLATGVLTLGTTESKCSPEIAPYCVIAGTKAALYPRIPTVKNTYRRIRLLPVELILDNKNIAYKPDSEALGVSNYVTNTELPATSQFNDTNPDPENFRLQARLPNSTTNSVQMKLEVKRDGAVVTTHNYPLDKKDGNFVRGQFLRLVTDTTDDGESGDQTILVKLGDKIKASYDIAAGSKVEQEIQVGRPSSEDNNEADKPWKHDIRKLKLSLHVFKKFDGSAPAVSRAEVEAAVRIASERFAQANIVCEPTYDFGQGNAGIPMPTGQGIDYSDGFDCVTIYGWSLHAEEEALFAFKDGDDNSIDVFFVERFSQPAINLFGGRGRSYPASYARGNVKYKNNAMCTVGGSDPFNLPHELLHDLLNRAHREPGEPTTALFKGGTSPTNVVNGTKRIGPYPDAAASNTGNDDVTTIRANAETLPQN